MKIGVNYMINTILVSTNSLCLDMMKRLCSEHLEISISGCFTSYSEAQSFAEDGTVDFAFIDYDERDEQAIELGASLRALNSSTVLIYLITQPRQSFEAAKIKADFCLIKPFSKSDFSAAIKRAYALNHSHSLPTMMCMFGKFGVFHNGRAVDFKSAKAKELFALCADHCGVEVTIEEAADKLWGEHPYDEKVKALYRKAVMNIRKALGEYNIENVFYVNRGSCGINPFNISCDYYKYRSEPQANLELYNGEYLSDYSWAEEKSAILHFQKDKFLRAISST